MNTIEQLKMSTMRSHKVIDSTGLIKKLKTSEVSPNDLQKFLSALYYFYKKYENAFLTYQDQRKKAYVLKSYYPTTLIEKDLHRPLQSDSFFKGDFSEEDYLGLSYLIYGSQKGNSFLKKHLERQSHAFIPTFFLRQFCEESWSKLTQDIEKAKYTELQTRVNSFF